MNKPLRANLVSRLSQGDSLSPFVRFQLLVLISMYIGYAALMLCRNTLAACSVQMMQDPTLNIDEASYGHLMAWHSAGAIMGKLVTGPGADLLGGRRMFLLALSLTAIANVGFAFSSTFTLFAAFNFFGQAAKAGGWPAMVQLVRSWFPSTRYGQVWSVIATSSRVGTIAAGLLFGFLLTLLDWRSVFLVSAALTAVIVFVLYFTLKEQPEDAGLPTLLDHEDELRIADESGGNESSASADTDTKTLAAQHALDQTTLWQACVTFAQSGRFWLIGFSIVFLTVCMDFVHFIPAYFAAELDFSAASSSAAGTAFPMGMFAALLITSFYYDRLSKLQLIGVIGCQLLFSVAAVLLLWRLDLVPESMQAEVAIITIFLLGLAISPAYYVPMSVFSVAFGGKHAGFLVAVIDIFGYAAAILFNYFGGTIAKDHGWPTFLSLLLAVTLLATICMVSFLTLDWRSTRSNARFEAKTV
ncbi:MAG: MFS transporter [Planctomycetaceae bacterium]|nr:MFS transporter [Planctomycetaceae bacterium]